MRLDHVALWTNQPEEVKTFYEKFFEGNVESSHSDPDSQFRSYFIRFENQVRLEVMQMPGVADNLNHPAERQHLGLIHVSFSVHSRKEVDALTEMIGSEGYQVIDRGVEYPDGYYESVVLDPNGNRLEITV